MKIKTFAFLALGGAAAYFGSDYPLVNTEELKIHKNYFNGSYTMQMNSEGITMKFDKRYEKELSVLTDSIQNLVKVSETMKDSAELEKAKEEINEQVKTKLRFR